MLAGLSSVLGGTGANSQATGKPNPMATVGQAGALAGNLADAIDTPNAYGRQSMGANMLKNVGNYTAMGAQFGPWGAAAGAAVGLVKGVVDTNQQKKQEARMKSEENTQRLISGVKNYEARAAEDPSAFTGNKGAQYFAGGGDLNSTGASTNKSLYSEYLKQKAKGGSLQRLSSDTVEVEGPSHEGGGVALPGGNEVEGKETIKGDYVLSHRLGFAQAHKPIAKAIGILEQKPLTQATFNSLRRLRSKEEALMLLQEQVREQNNIQ